MKQNQRERVSREAASKAGKCLKISKGHDEQALATAQAWRGGPVVPELYALHRGKFLIRPGELEGGDSSTLTDHERSVIDNVCAAMGHATGAELSERTHRESPWLDARDGRKPSEPSDTVITQDAMHSYYLEHPVLI